MQDEVYCPENKKIDMGNKRVTDIKVNRRVMLPDPRPAGEEATLMVRRERLLDVVEEYINEKCDEKGQVKESNFYEQERIGVKKLSKRVKEKEIVIRPTDKSHKLSISSMDNYIEQGKPHTEGDRRVGWRDVIRRQELLQRYSG